MKHTFDTDFVYKSSQEYVLGQDVALKRFVEALNLALRLVDVRDEYDVIDLPKASTVCLIGPTASGKTHMVKTVCRFANIKYFVVDVSSLSREGWQGSNISDVMKDVEVWQATHEEEPFVIFWDEFDKVSGKPDELHKEGGAIPNLLKVLECEDKYTHHEHAIEVSVNMKRSVHVLAGAFTGIEDIVAKRVSANSAGFLGSAGSMSAADLRSLCVQDDLHTYGLTPELIGRISSIISVPELDADTLAAILINDNGIIAQFNRLLPDGCEFKVSDEAVAYMAETAAENSFGARHLLQQLSPLAASAAANVSDNNNVAEVVLSDDTLKLTYHYADEVRDRSGAASQDIEIVRKGTYHQIAKGIATRAEVMQYADSIDTYLRNVYEHVPKLVSAYSFSSHRRLYMMTQRTVLQFDAEYGLSDGLLSWNRGATILFGYSITMSSFFSGSYATSLFSYVDTGLRDKRHRFDEFFDTGSAENLWTAFLSGVHVPYMQLEYLLALSRFLNRYSDDVIRDTIAWYDRYAYVLITDNDACKKLAEIHESMNFELTRKRLETWFTNLMIVHPEYFLVENYDSIAKQTLLARTLDSELFGKTLYDEYTSFCLALNEKALADESIVPDLAFMDQFRHDVENGLVHVIPSGEALATGRLFVRIDARLFEYLEAACVVDETKTNYEMLSEIFVLLPGIIVHQYSPDLNYADFAVFSGRHASLPAHVTLEMLQDLVDTKAGSRAQRQADFIVQSGLYDNGVLADKYTVPPEVSYYLAKRKGFDILKH